MYNLLIFCTIIIFVVLCNIDLSLLQFKTLSKLGVEAYGVILNQATSDCKVLCSSETVKEFVSTEEGQGQAVDNNFFRFMCGKSI